MTKRLLTLPLAMALVAMTAVAAPVSREQAREQARRFAQTKGRGVSTAPHLAHRVPARPGAATSPYYIFDLDPADGGFVVVSGDDRTAPILGYADGGTFDPARIPTNMQAWLDGYADAIAALDDDAQQQPQQPLMRAADAAERTPVPVLMTTTWDQGSPYNNSCPTLGGQRCPTGCVATAIAQIMYHQRWPQGPTEVIPSYTYEVDGQTYTRGQLRSVTFDWDAMRDHYDGNADGSAIATLMLYVGQASHMTYAPAGSATLSGEGARALRECFGYDVNTRLVSRAGHTIDSWEGLIWRELAEGRPVYYAAVNTGGAHAFVCDGYDADGLFHINWGWGGWCNGFFRLSVLNPDDQSGIGASPTPDGYSMGQEAIIGIQPPTGLPEEPKEVKVNFTELSVSSGRYIVYDLWNSLDVGTHVFDFGLATVDEEGHVVDVIDQWSNGEALPPGFGFVGVSRDIHGRLSPGEYRIQPVSREQGTERWLTGSEFMYVSCTVNANGTMQLKAHPYVSVRVTAIDYPGNHIATQPQEVRIKVRNTGDELYREAFLFAYRNAGEQRKVATRTGLIVRANSEDTLSLYFTPEEEGRYTIDIALDDRDSRRIGSGKVDIRGFMLPDDLTTTEGGQLTTSHQGINNAETPAMAIDNNLTTKFCANINPAGTVWLRYRLREPIVLTSYSISSANDAPERDPRTWRLQGSSDGRTWTDLDSRTDELFPSRYLTRTYDVEPADTAFTWFRLYVQQRRDADAAVFQIAEWQLYGHAPEPDAITAVAADQAAPAPVYSLDGRRLPASRSLSPGVYIVGGRKRVIGAGGRE